MAKKQHAGAAKKLKVVKSTGVIGGVKSNGGQLPHVDVHPHALDDVQLTPNDTARYRSIYMAIQDARAEIDKARALATHLEDHIVLLVKHDYNVDLKDPKKPATIHFETGTISFGPPIDAPASAPASAPDPVPAAADEAGDA